MGTYIKSVLRSVKSSFSRFLAIFTIVALGVGFLAGLLSTPADMRNSVGVYLEDSRFMDLRVAGNLGMCVEDVEALRALPGVADVMPARSIDYLVTTDGQDSMVARIHDMDFSAQRDGYESPGVSGGGSVNQGVLVDGRWPESKNECVIELEAAYMLGLAVGGTLTVTGENKDVDEVLDTTTFSIVGHVTSSAYLSMLQRGYTTVGNGKLAVILYIDPDCFVTDYYTDIYITLADSGSFETYSAAYDDYAAAAVTMVEELGETQKYVRRDAILEDAQRQLDEARETLAEKRAEADRELKDALDKLLEGQQDLTDGQRELLDGRKKVMDGRRELQDRWAEYEEGVADLAQGRLDYEKEIADADAELVQGEAELLDAEAELADGRRQLEEGQRDLEEGAAQFADGEARLQEARGTFNSGLRQLNDAKRQLDEAKIEIDDGRAELDEGKALLDDSKKEIDDGFAAIRAGEAEMSQGARQIQEAEAELAAGEQQLALAKEALVLARQALQAAVDNKEELQRLLDSMESPTDEEIIAGMEQYLADNRAAYEAALANPDPTDADLALIALYEQMESALENSESILEQWHQLEAQLQDVEGMIAAAENQLSAAEAEVAANEALLADGRAQLSAARAQLEAGQRELEKGEQLLIDGRIEYEAGLKDWEAGEKVWQEGYDQWLEGYTAWEEGMAQLEEGRPALEEAEAELEANRVTLTDAYREVEENRQKLEDGERELAQGWLDLEDGKRKLAEGKEEAEAEFADAEAQLADALILLEDAELELADAERELTDGEQELTDGELELLDGWAEYEDAVAEVEEKLQEAEDEITEAEDKLRDIESPKWYVLDRNTNPGYVSFDSDSQKIAAIAQVFPVFFILVATLVASTTMTRMVEEERGNIGTLKALGYTNGAIAAKFIFYAGFAAILGSVAGLLIGLRMFPGIIYNAYGLMYNLPPLTPSDHTFNSVVSTGVIFLGIMVATLGALKSSLGENAASLMQPKAPKAGKRIFLEHITPLWKRLRFTHKVTARNLIRYKKRFFMTVVGIFGCTALLLTGFGLRDSISDIIDIQFNDLFGYNLTVGLKHDGDDTSDRRIRQVLEDGEAILDYTPVSQETSILYHGGKSLEVTTVVPRSADELAGYVDFRDRTSKSPVAFDAGSALLSEKAAKTLNVSPGDVIQLENSDNERADFTVTGIIENYVQSYIYIAPQLYDGAYTAPVAYTTLLVKAADATQEIRDEISTRLLVSPNVTAVQFTTGLMDTFTEMLSTIDFIVVVLILCAGLLAFVVMYNLTNINITERQKELATIKVLGFYQREVNMYIFRETTILAMVGAAVGLIGGIFLHQFVVTTAEVDNMMFGRNIKLLSYILSFAITIAFSLIVNFIMSFKLKKINMADSLKAPE